MEGYSDSVTKNVNHNDISGNYNAYMKDLSYNKKTTTTSGNTVDISGNQPTFSNIDVSSLFNKSNLILIVWFLAIYLVAYFVLGYFFNKGSTAGAFQTALGRMLDFIIIGVIIIFIFSSYYSTTETERQTMM